jgi:lysophospholipid acyltransferase (LPLAT)-like uncharacterized protein
MAAQGAAESRRLLWWGSLRVRIISHLAAWLIRALGATWRVRSEGVNPLHSTAANLGALWHQDALISAWWFRDLGITIPVSRSSDGDIVTPIVVALGFSEPPRGSSSRGGAAALRGLVRHIKHGATAAILVDGPRGPALQSKIGVVSLARLSGTPITPVVFNTSAALRIPSWDRTIVPLPFARIVARFGEPIQIPGDASPEEEEALRAEVDACLSALSTSLDAAVAAQARRGRSA